MGGSMSGNGGSGASMVPWANISSSVAHIGEGWYTAHQLDKGSNAAREAQQRANKLYKQLYSETEGDYKPYQQGGADAFQALLRTYGQAEGQNGVADYTGFENSPDYLWARQMGEQGANRLAAANGRLYSGAQMKALSQFNQGLASQYLDSYRRGLYNISGIGMGATNALSQYRGGYGNQLGQGEINLGDIEYARRMGKASINSNNVAQQDRIWGGYTGPTQRNQLNTNSSYQNWQPSSGSPGSGSYSGPGSSSYQFNPWGG